MTVELKYRVRGDFLLCRIVQQDRVGSLAVPQQSSEGKRFIVVGKGEKVKDIELGERVILVANPGEGCYYPIPNEKDLFVIKQEFVALIVEEG